MAEDSKKKRRVVKKPVQTVREKATKAQAAPEKPRRLHRTVKKVGRPVHAARRIGAKEYYLPMPDNRAGRFLNKRRRWMPKFFREAWGEVKQVEWPNRLATAKLTFAVFVFAITFMLIISVVDFGLDKLFKQLLLS